MKLAQFFLPGKGKRVGLVHDDRVLDITSAEEGVRSTLDLVTQGKTVPGMLTRVAWLARRIHRRALDWRELQRAPSRRVPHVLVPIDSPEIWGVDHPASRVQPATSGAADSVCSTAAARRADASRPAFFFKATAQRVVGPGDPIGIRKDSTLTVPEASLAVVLGPAGSVMAFTACNDVTARDIGRCGREFLSQAKTYLGCCALGPCLVTPDEIQDDRVLQMRCSILRSGKVIFSAATGIEAGQTSIASRVGWLVRDNPVPPGTVMAIGTGIYVPDGAALIDGDHVEIELQGVGRLRNVVRGG